MRPTRWLTTTALLLAAGAASAQEGESPRGPGEGPKPAFEYKVVHVRDVQATNRPDDDKGDGAAKAAPKVQAIPLRTLDLDGGSRLGAVQQLLRLHGPGANDPHHDVILKLKAVANESCAQCHTGGVSLKKDEGLGLTLVPADETLRSQLKLDKTGLVVTAVAKGSAAEEGGVKEKDIVVAVQGMPLESVEAFNGVLERARAKVGPRPAEAAATPKATSARPIVIKIVRAGETRELTVPPPPQGILIVGGLANAPEGAKAPSHWIGVSIGEVDDILRAHLKLPEGAGLVVTDVINGAPAEKAGLKKDDVLLSIDGKPLKAPEDMVQAVRASRGDKAVRLEIRRAGDALAVSVKPEPRKDDGTQALSARVHPVRVGDAPQAWVAQVLPFLDGGLNQPLAFSTIQAPQGQLFVTNQPFPDQPINLYTGNVAPASNDGAEAQRKLAAEQLHKAVTADVERVLREVLAKSEKSAAPGETLSRIDAQLKALETQVREIKRSMDELKGAIKKEKP